MRRAARSDYQVFRSVPEQRVHEPPECVAAQADRDQDQEHLSERLVGDRL
jgi:hypothetical protein